MKPVVIKLDFSEFRDGTITEHRTYTLLGRGERRCGVERRHGQCPEPAAILIDLQTSDIAMCARCYEECRDQREPELAEMRKEASECQSPII